MAWVSRRWVHARTAASVAGVLVLSACTGKAGGPGRTGPSRPPVVAVLSPQATLYLTPARGGTARPLLRPRDAARLRSEANPAWSPDGRWIAFTAGCVSCLSRLYVLSRDGRRLREISTGEGSAASPAWSPNGRTIVFVRQRGETQELYSVDLRTDRLRLVNGEPEGVDNSDSAPAWAPAGRWIAFSREVHHEHVNLYLVPAAGGHPRRLTRRTTFEQTHPSWSPDGRQVVFMQAVPPHFTWDLFMLNARRGATRPITRTPHNEFDPTWSPDGKQIVFASDAASRAGFRSLYVIGASGRGLRRLTAAPDDDSMPSWSPDGAAIAFVRRPIVRT